MEFTTTRGSTVKVDGSILTVKSYGEPSRYGKPSKYDIAERGIEHLELKENSAGEFRVAVVFEDDIFKTLNVGRYATVLEAVTLASLLLHAAKISHSTSA